MQTPKKVREHFTNNQINYLTGFGLYRDIVFILKRLFLKAFRRTKSYLLFFSPVHLQIWNGMTKFKFYR